METIPKMIVKNKMPFLIAFLLSVSWAGKTHISLLFERSIITWSTLLKREFSWPFPRFKSLGKIGPVYLPSAHASGSKRFDLLDGLRKISWRGVSLEILRRPDLSPTLQFGFKFVYQN
jgi:hypothetical protein